MPLNTTDTFILGVAVTLASWLVVHKLTKRRDTEGRRRTHRTQLRLIAAAFPGDSHTVTVRKIDEWWLTAVDDYGWLSRRSITHRIAQFKQVNFPVRDWDVNVEDEYTPEKTEPYQAKLNEANRAATALLNQIINKT
jgi:hypothetical protein